MGRSKLIHMLKSINTPVDQSASCSKELSKPDAPISQADFRKDLENLQIDDNYEEPEVILKRGTHG